MRIVLEPGTLSRFTLPHRTVVITKFTAGDCFSDEQAVKFQADWAAESGWPLGKMSSWKGIEKIGGDDGTRTRALMRDRQHRLEYLVDFAARLAT